MKISIDKLTEDVSQYSDVYKHERAKRLGVSKSGIKKAIKHPKAKK
ncbi:IS630 transposase-related protein [Orientia tsutsugamushi]|nr:IS630 transposase-related protein [Orientia tsutsugamushi]